MSIVIGIATKDHVLVASDGRIFSSAVYANGTIITHGEIMSDGFDKTFSLDNHLIGAVAGTMKVGDRTIAENLIEINKQNLEFEVADRVNAICHNLRGMLQNISEEEIAFGFRKLDLIFVSSKDTKIYVRQFFPNEVNNAIVLKEKEIMPTRQNPICWQVFGDDNACGVVTRYLSEEIPKMSTIKEQDLKSLVYKAIRNGINHSGDHPESNCLCGCGGKIYLRTLKKISYKQKIGAKFKKK